MKNIMYTIGAFMVVVFLVFALFFNKSPEKTNPTRATTPTPTTVPDVPVNSSPQQSEHNLENAGVPLTAEEALTTDPQDRNPKLAAKEKAIARKFALLQTLPYEKNGYVIEFKDVNKSNKVLLEVRYPGSLSAAKSKYQQLLRQTHDNGSAYKVTYKHG